MGARREGYMRDCFNVDREKMTRETWPLWMCLKPDSLAKWKKLRERHGLTSDLKADPFQEIEDIEEIDRLMREKPTYRGNV